MCENANKSKSTPASHAGGGDLLGQTPPDLEAPNPTDKSCRELSTVASLRQAITAKGGQPK